MELRVPLRCGMTMLAIQGHGAPIRRRLSEIPLEVDDLLLVVASFPSPLFRDG